MKDIDKILIFFFVSLKILIKMWVCLVGISYDLMIICYVYDIFGVLCWGE